MYNNQNLKDTKLRRVV